MNVPYAYAKDIYAISTAGIDCYVSAESIRQTSDKSFYVHIKNAAHPQDNESESIAYFEGTRRTNLREVYGHNAELQKKFLYNLDKPPCSVINLDVYGVRSYFISLFK